MRKFVSCLLVCILALVLVACGNTAAPSNTQDNPGASSGGKVSVGLALPSKELAIWGVQGDKMTQALEKAGYTVMVEYAEDVVERQVAQIENFVTKGAKYIIITAVDGYTLSDAVKKAKNAGCTVIANDRLVMNSDAVDYYVTYDMYNLGKMQGDYIEQALGLKEGKGPFNMEIFTGSLDDPNIIPFYNGAMDVLTPYVDSGKLIVRSGQKSMEETSIFQWSSATAQARMDNLIGAFYSNEKIDAVLTMNDSIAIGVISSLNSMGYGSGGHPFPVIVGQDCELSSIKYIKEGKQSMSVLIDPVMLADRLSELITSLEAGKTIEPDVMTNNNTIEVPTLQYDLVAITKDNINILIDRGFYTESELE